MKALAVIILLAQVQGQEVPNNYVHKPESDGLLMPGESLDQPQQQRCTTVAVDGRWITVCE
jgi:hypothetical protein